MQQKWEGCYIERLARHEDQALQKFAYLDTKLRNDPRLSAIHDYS